MKDLDYFHLERAIIRPIPLWKRPMLKFYDFFAGAGLATLALRNTWNCIWANDIDERKAQVYRENSPSESFICKDIADVSVDELPDGGNMAWASFPCQDLSLAGWRRGLSAERSGTFWQFWRLMHEKSSEGKQPPIIVIENVVGLLYGDNFTGLFEALAALEMQFGALIIDARHFLPQSRPRVFIIAVDARFRVEHLTTKIPGPVWGPSFLKRAVIQLPKGLHDLWRWWDMPVPKKRRVPLSKILETMPAGVKWHTEKETNYILSLMSESNLGKIEAVKRIKGRHIGFMYKRIRQGRQRAEVRFDGISGCLRTPQGGSSRQTVIVVEKGKIKSRLLSPREAARLMGVPDSFTLPQKYNDAYRAMGDGVAVPVVRWLSEHLLEPLAGLTVEHSNGAAPHPRFQESLENSKYRVSQWSALSNAK